MLKPGSGWDLVSSRPSFPPTRDKFRKKCLPFIKVWLVLCLMIQDRIDDDDHELGLAIGLSIINHHSYYNHLQLFDDFPTGASKIFTWLSCPPWAAKSVGFRCWKRISKNPRATRRMQWQKNGWRLGARAQFFGIWIWMDLVLPKGKSPCLTGAIKLL